MRPKDLLQGISNVNWPVTRGFQRVGASDLCQDASTVRNQRQEYMRQPPIELKDLQSNQNSIGPLLVPNSSSPTSVTSTTLSSIQEDLKQPQQIREDSQAKNAKGSREVFIKPKSSRSEIPFLLNDDSNSFQIYNPTSEELPVDVIDEETLPFALSDVRLALRQMSSEIGHEDMNHIHMVEPSRETQNVHPGRLRRWVACAFYICCGLKCSQGHLPVCRQQYWTSRYMILLACGLLPALILGMYTMYVILTRGLHISQSQEVFQLNEFGLEILRKQNWPIHDLRSRRLNISFDLSGKIKLPSSWNFDDKKEADEEEPTEAKDSHLTTTKKPSLAIKRNQPIHNGNPVDELILADSILVAERVLKGKLHANSSKLEVLHWKGLAGAIAVAEMRSRLNIENKNSSITGLLKDDLCYVEPDFSCNDTSWFRSIDGKCNNVIHKSWGSQYSPLRRILNPIDFNGKRKQGNPFLFSTILRSNDSKTFPELSTSLPSSDLVSSKVHGGTPEDDSHSHYPSASILLPIWGMFILQDTVKIANSPVNCCDQTNTKISINEVEAICNLKSASYYVDGVNYKKHKCGSSRFLPAWYPSCQLEPRTSFNLVTSFIDGSNIYGSISTETDKLRLKKYGKLLVHKLGEGFLPKAESFNESCYFGSPVNAEIPNCVLSGNPDSNLLVPLTTLNTIFVRQHNLIATKLRHLNRHWDDEKLFQESRRIVVAQIQHITYSEFLPQILGPDVLKLAGLSLERQDFPRIYHPEIDPTVSVAFASTVSKFLYSMITKRVKQAWRRGNALAGVTYDLSWFLFKPDYLTRHRGNLESLIRGLTSIHSNRVGVEFTSQLHSLHFNISNSTINLVGMAIQLGRDLDVPSYIEWRKVCGFPSIKSFQDIEKFWNSEAFTKVTSTYGYIEDVDLFTGMLAETPISSGRVGPTLACLLADQFVRFRRGDRFWYEDDISFHHFFPEQLQVIRETTLARIICENTDKFEEIQKWPMLLTTSTNPTLPCGGEEIPPFTVHPWKEGLPLKESMKYKVDVHEEVNSAEWNTQSMESHAINSESGSEERNDKYVQKLKIPEITSMKEDEFSILRRSHRILSE